MKTRSFGHNVVLGTALVALTLLLLSCQSGPQNAPADAVYSVPATGSTAMLPEVPWDGNWTTGHVFPQQVLVEADSSRIAVIYQVPGELRRQGLSMYPINPYGFSLARHPFAGIMAEVLDFETGAQIAREMLVQSEVQTIVPIFDEDTGSRAQPSMWLLFHSAELPMGPTREPFDRSDDGVIQFHSDGLGGYERLKIADFDRQSLGGAQFEMLRSGAIVSPDGIHFARVNNSQLQFGSMADPHGTLRTVAAPEEVYEPDNPPREPYPLRVIGWSDDTTVLLERGSANELWMIDARGAEEPVLVNAQPDHRNRMFTFFQSPRILTMHTDQGGSAYDTLEIWSVDGYEVQSLGRGATSKTSFIPVFVPRNRPDLLMLRFDGTVQVYETDGFRLIQEIRGSVPPGANAALSRIALDSPGERVFLAWSNGTIDVWDLENNRPIGTWDLAAGDTRQLEYERIWTQHGGAR